MKSSRIILLVTAAFCLPMAANSQIQARRPVTGVEVVNDLNQMDYRVITADKSLPVLLSILKEQKLKPLRGRDDIPTFLMEFIQSLFDSKIELANTAEEWGSDCINSEHQPEWLLLYAGLSNNMFALSYRTGGYEQVEHAFLIRFEGNQILDLWKGEGRTEDIGGLVDISAPFDSQAKILAWIKAKQTKPCGLHLYRCGD